MTARAPKPPRPLWRRLFDTAERAAAGPLEALTNSEAFADALAAARRLDGATRRRVVDASNRVLHLWNLPSARDVSRLHRQVSMLEQRVRDLTRSLEAAKPRTPQREAPPRDSEAS